MKYTELVIKTSKREYNFGIDVFDIDKDRLLGIVDLFKLEILIKRNFKNTVLKRTRQKG